MVLLTWANVLHAACRGFANISESSTHQARGPRAVAEQVVYIRVALFKVCHLTLKRRRGSGRKPEGNRKEGKE